MDVLSVGGNDYVKASVIARDLGYTADYVGQLCRSHKVKAKLVGRSWYVERRSILDHKSNRYRSTQTKTKETLRDDVVRHVELNKGVGEVTSGSHFYKHSPASKPIAFTTDPADLIPVVSKKQQTIELPVELADASDVPVVSRDQKYNFTSPKLPKIKFAGSLVVTDYEEDEEKVDVTIPDGTRIMHPIAVAEGKKKPKNIASSAFSVPLHRRSFKEKFLTQTVNRPVPAKITARKPGESMVEEQKSSAPVYIAAAFVSFLIVFILLGLESHILVTEQIVSTSYSFGIDNISASAYESAEEIRNIFSRF